MQFECVRFVLCFLFFLLTSHSIYFALWQPKSTHAEAQEITKSIEKLAREIDEVKLALLFVNKSKSIADSFPFQQLDISRSSTSPTHENATPAPIPHVVRTKEPLFTGKPLPSLDISHGELVGSMRNSAFSKFCYCSLLANCDSRFKYRVYLSGIIVFTARLRALGSTNDMVVLVNFAPDGGLTELPASDLALTAKWGIKLKYVESVWERFLEGGNIYDPQRAKEKSVMYNKIFAVRSLLQPLSTFFL
jgi:hypothetical protein